MQLSAVDPLVDRRIRLLAFVDASFFSPYTRRSGKRYPIFTGDAQWFFNLKDNLTLARDLGKRRSAQRLALDT